MSRELLIISSKEIVPPESGTFSTLSHHIIDSNNSFITERDRLSNKIARSLLGGRDVSLLATGSSGVVAVAAAIENPALGEVVTVGARFKNTVYPRLAPSGDKFENQGIAWLEENGVPSELLEKTITVFFKGNVYTAPSEARLKGSTWRPIKLKKSDGSGSPESILTESIDKFFIRKK